MQPSPIRLITIDLDDTLWPCKPTIMAAEQTLYQWLQRNTPRLTAQHSLSSLREHRLGVMRDEPGQAHDLTYVRRRSLQLLFDQHDYGEDLLAQAMAVVMEARNRVSPYAEVSTILRTLAADYRLISLTNGNADVQRTPLRGHFHHAITAADAGAAKPDPAMFHKALHHAGVQANEALHVGDDPLLDVAAARTVGLTTAWMNRGGAAWPDEQEPPDIEIRDLRDLASWLSTR